MLLFYISTNVSFKDSVKINNLIDLTFEEIKLVQKIEQLGVILCEKKENKIFSFKNSNKTKYYKKTKSDKKKLDNLQR